MGFFCGVLGLVDLLLAVFLVLGEGLLVCVLGLEFWCGFGVLVILFLFGFYMVAFGVIC